MINKLIAFAIKQRLLVGLALVGFVAWGIVSYQRVPIDAFPDVTNNQVQILTTVPGFSPVEVEKQVTYPIEIEMSSLPNLVESRSISQFGLSAITLVFEDDMDVYFARQLVFERLASVQEELPEGVTPEMGPVSTGLGEIYQYTIEGEDYTPMQRRTIQDWMIAPSLRGVPGVIEVNSLGGYVKQYQVLVNPERLVAYEVTLNDVFSAVAENNANAGGNYITRNFEQFLVRGVGLINDEKDIEDIVVASRNGTPVYIRDVASVEIGPAVRYGAATKDGKGETVIGIVMMLKGESGRDVVKSVKEKLEEIKKALPEGIRVVPYYDRIELVNAALNTVTSSLLIGGFLVVLVLAFFLGNLRSAFIVALVLPMSALISFIIMYYTGLSANLMSLGGLAIGIGMMVDGAIVVVENVIRHIQENQRNGSNESIAVTVLRAAQEVGRPSAFAIFVVVIVFLPLMTLTGLEGKMFSPLALTISFALFSSLLLALTLAPLLSTFLLKGKISDKKNVLVEFLKRVYRPILERAVDNRKLTALLALLLFVASLGLLPFLGTEFVPELEEGAIALQAIRLPTIALQGSNHLSSAIEREVLKTPEVITIVSRTGRAEVATDPMQPNFSDMYIMLKPLSEWRDGYGKEEIVDELRERLKVIPGVIFSFSQPIALRVEELISGVRSQLAVKVFGEDLGILKKKGDEIVSILNSVRGARDVQAEQVTGLGYLQIKIDRRKVARYGLNVSDIQDVVEIAIGGKIATTILEGDRRFAALVRLAEPYRKDLEEIRSILVSTPDGNRIPLAQLADIYIEQGPAQVSREDSKRRLTIQCNVSGRDIGSFVAEAQEKIDASVELPPGYFITWGGQFENQQRANRRLAVILPITLVLIVILLFSTFNSMKNALLILLNLPITITGGIFALWAGGLYLSVPASVGFIALMGTAVQNGIVMVSFINDMRRQGTPLREALIEGGLLRLRPILMTALTTLLGLFPLLLSQGIGSEVQRPLAAVVIGGLFSTIVSTLLLLPAFYGWFEEKPASPEL
ncbi:MAG TPA: efflux RND transporter permease subunit [Bacteroidetes bacterium]|nr:efflux RND transporter permease subunit [Bacteroidota bacterium]